VQKEDPLQSGIFVVLEGFFSLPVGDGKSVLFRRASGVWSRKSENLWFP
jgi:hypothetical protein